MRRATLFSLLGASLLATALAPVRGEGQAENSDARRGREIAEEADRRFRGYGDVRVRMQMLLRDRRGRETRRELEVFTLEGRNGEDRSLVYFESPRDIRGTGLLTHSHRGRDDEQWLFLPALGRTTRIAASNRSSSFMGSELAYEDLAEDDVHDFTYRFVREDTLRGTDCYVVERSPTYAGTGYRRQQVYFDQAEYRVLQIDYWDRRDRHLKTLSSGGYRRHLGRLWRPSRARMLNHLTNDATMLTWREYRFGTGLTESDFSRDALRRAR